MRDRPAQRARPFGYFAPASGPPASLSAAASATNRCSGPGGEYIWIATSLEPGSGRHACFAFGGVCAAIYAFSQGETVPVDNQF